jgi:hypothetical protein
VPTPVRFVQTFRWPFVAVVMTLIARDSWPCAAVALALVFKPELSAALRDRRVEVRWGGIMGCVRSDRRTEAGRPRRNDPVAASTWRRSDRPRSHDRPGTGPPGFS